jgi:hypothetical protein
MKFPKRVKRLAAKDICQHMGDGPYGTHCLGNWAWAYFPSPSGIGICDIALEAISKKAGTQEIVRFNDHLAASKSTIAAVWNRAMESLGYKLAKNGKYFYMPKKKVS